MWTSAIAGRRANGNIPGGSNNKMELSEFEFQPWCFNKVDANRNFRDAAGADLAY